MFSLLGESDTVWHLNFPSEPASVGDGPGVRYLVEVENVNMTVGEGVRVSVGVMLGIGVSLGTGVNVGAASAVWVAAAAAVWTMIVPIALGSNVGAEEGIETGNTQP